VHNIGTETAKGAIVWSFSNGHGNCTEVDANEVRCAHDIRRGCRALTVGSWLVGPDGGLFAFGDPAVWGSHGDASSYGSAPHLGGMSATPLNAPVRAGFEL
jgi:hypothetical protein